MRKSRKPALRNLALAAGTALAALSMAGSAGAYEAVVTYQAPLLAGPSTGYPPIADLYAGSPVEVYGCLDGWDWCDVSFQGYRGWFDGQMLGVPYEGQQVPIFDYGYAIGLPIIGFDFNDYWRRYYYNRPFFGERGRYAHVAMPPPRPHEGRPHFEGEHGSGPGGRPGFEQGRPGFEQGRPGFQQGSEQGHGPAPQGRPGFDQGHAPAQQARPEGDQGRGPGPRMQADRPQAPHPEAARPAPQAQHPAPQAPHPAPAPQAQAPHPQGEKPAAKPEPHHDEH